MKNLSALFILAVLMGCSRQEDLPRESILFTRGWKFQLGDVPDAEQRDFNDAGWRVLDLPHDWSIEGEFSEDNPCGNAGGALPTGIGWYRKTFRLPAAGNPKRWYIDFDGVYRNSEVWINGHYLGKRASGYSSFRYDLTPWLSEGDEENVLAVRVDNSLQPNSRWYTGSGIYRNVWLTATGDIHIGHWGSFVRTPSINGETAKVELDLEISNLSGQPATINVKTVIYGPLDKEAAIARNEIRLEDSVTRITQAFEISNPALWSPTSPTMYRAETRIFLDRIEHGLENSGQKKSGLVEADRYETPFGIRYYEFHAEKGFSLNGKPLRIYGANQHHDLGALGAAVNERARERQLEILREMGCNAIRTAHNLPAPELLDLTDRMGFLVMDECFDVWARRKLPQDGHRDWKDWHTVDLQDMVRRDRNHPSIILWSLGNEIPEQFDSSGTRIALELAETLRALDYTRPVTCALTEHDPSLNHIYQSGALDVISFNYKHYGYADLPELYPGEKLLTAENVSAFATRGHYDMPSDSVRIWPHYYTEPFELGNPDFTASSYDNAHASWGTTHEANLDAVNRADFLAGMFIWSGFDYLGEPTPYPYPARSTYLGVIDLAGFPKDAYYLYQAEWTDREVLHLFPHWNWEPGQEVDVWAYYNNADEVELFLNGESLGTRSKGESKYHVMWRVPFEAGILSAVKKKDGRLVQEKEIHTAGEPAKIELMPDRSRIKADGRDLSFITVRILDEEGNLCPRADNLVRFDVSGAGSIAGVDNGYQASLEPFKADYRKAFNGMCLLIVQAGNEEGEIHIEADSDGLEPAEHNIVTH